ncbi:AGR283Cp [Eremothecium gossypii ATCC 10895]|uniref:AGR283Cp n=1 Tax=Eremothecium gossypii (strain ATCC 10895 / CBS 109.51 / FGSC 9923 / NRRL Y-1056) TaxID=284811 RepID=Q74ZB6_EREGS|nr:AGR283Cp [Eremothecium gossypii ATCC 10895]AAS54773.1 AGR283Cp [Eremothecium gossypii ATCC 10895]AEY99104.1 FAGR283Cp [Eremothecium gossypii FDAG1]
MEVTGTVSHYKDGAFFVITLAGKKLNSLTLGDYMELVRLMREADQDDEVLFTVFQGHGKMFSAGGNVESFSRVSVEGNNRVAELMRHPTSPVLLFGNTFATHSKVTVACLNGPAYGLSAAFVLMCDLVYAMNDQIYLELPFASLALGPEGALSDTLPGLLGRHMSNRSLILGDRIPYAALEGKLFPGHYGLQDPEEFNRRVLGELREHLKTMDRTTLMGTKRLLQERTRPAWLAANATEAHNALNNFVRGVPQQRFFDVTQRIRKSKL